ncbi:MAG TPA: FkbM family methyltransferase [Verrucomicrobiota bacterium]|nr:FkbM family methyltransferase [Verrucomicrobiota bacterium]
MNAGLHLLKSKLKTAFERTFGVTVYRTMPRGVDPLHDLALLVPDWSPVTIFDVGANIGQSAMEYAKRFPSARISSFEPAAGTFRQLERNVKAFPNVRCFQVALAAESGDALLTQNDRSDLNRIVRHAPGDLPAAGCERVVKRTLDAFCEELRVPRIHYLKIDTEGADLDVLRGAERMLGDQQVDVIEVEVGIGLDNDRHVTLQPMRQHLEARGYRVFGFYEQVNEWTRKLPHLRRVNVVFISGRLDQPPTRA